MISFNLRKGMIFSFYFKILTLYPFLSARRMTSFFFEDTSFSFRCKNLTRKWLKLVAESEIRRLGDINIIFCSDNYILDINQRYLGHDYFTDIITFDYCEGDKLNGDLFISVDSASSFPSLSIKSYLARTYAVIGSFSMAFTVGFLMNLLKFASLEKMELS